MKILKVLKKNWIWKKYIYSMSVLYIYKYNYTVIIFWNIRNIKNILNKSCIEEYILLQKYNFEIILNCTMKITFKFSN